ncbi:MAG: YaiO family outer membrane beta-barrel protein [Flavobacterium sp.]|nr:YaiO family outer membrane beta-barrel protein [Flavobacterium sp.]
MKQKFPDEAYFKNELENIKNETELDQIGFNYSYTHFNRSNYGPWHYSSIQYLRQREKITLIGRVNFTDRRVNGSSTNSGLLYEFETYFKNYEKSYSYFNIGFGNESVFPKFKISYSYFQDLGKGWEGEMGYRYNEREVEKINSGVIGIGKYFGSNWINARTYVFSRRKQNNIHH